jgi:hypothetical protein
MHSGGFPKIRVHVKLELVSNISLTLKRSYLLFNIVCAIFRVIYALQWVPQKKSAREIRIGLKYKFNLKTVLIFIQHSMYYFHLFNS